MAQCVRMEAGQLSRGHSKGRTKGPPQVLQDTGKTLKGSRHKSVLKESDPPRLKRESFLAEPKPTLHCNF